MIKFWLAYILSASSLLALDKPSHPSYWYINYTDTRHVTEVFIDGHEFLVEIISHSHECPCHYYNSWKIEEKDATEKK
jgi:hypothetical protein